MSGGGWCEGEVVSAKVEGEDEPSHTESRLGIVAAVACMAGQLWLELNGAPMSCPR